MATSGSDLGPALFVTHSRLRTSAICMPVEQLAIQGQQKCASLLRSPDYGTTGQN